MNDNRIKAKPRSRFARCVCAAATVLVALSIVSCSSDAGDDEAPCTPASRPFSTDLVSETRPEWASRWDEETLSAGAVVATSESATDDEMLDRVLDCAGLSDHDIVSTPSGQRLSAVTVGVQQYLVSASRIQSAEQSYTCSVVITRLGGGSARFGVTAFEVHGGRLGDTAEDALVVQRLRSSGIL